MTPKTLLRWHRSSESGSVGDAFTSESSEWVVFEDSAHMAHAEETKSYLEVVDDFLTRRSVPLATVGPVN